MLNYNKLRMNYWRFSWVYSALLFFTSVRIGYVCRDIRVCSQMKCADLNTLLAFEKFRTFSFEKFTFLTNFILHISMPYSAEKTFA